MAQQKNTISIFSAVLAISAVNAKCGLIRGKSDDHFDCIMQNKPNFRKGQMNINIFTTKDYENQPIWSLRENKANQSQFLTSSNDGLSFLRNLSSTLIGEQESRPY
jgi:hypothetical protein